MATIERSKELATLWEKECYRSNQVIFREKYNLVDYGTKIPWPKKEIEVLYSCYSVKESKKIVAFIEKFISSLQDDNIELISLYQIYRDNKNVAELPTLYVVGSGHWSRAEISQTGLSQEGLFYSKALYAGQYTHWFEVTGEVDFYQGGPRIKRFCESAEFFSTEEQMIEKVLRNSYAEDLKINDSNIFVRVKTDNKGRFIGKGGDNIKRLEIICKKKIILKDNF